MRLPLSLSPTREFPSLLHLVAHIKAAAVQQQFVVKTKVGVCDITIICSETMHQKRLLGMKGVNCPVHWKIEEVENGNCRVSSFELKHDHYVGEAEMEKEEVFGSPSEDTVARMLAAPLVFKALKAIRTDTSLLERVSNSLTKQLTFSL